METLTPQTAKHHCRICLQSMVKVSTDSNTPGLCYHLQQSPLKDWIQTLTPLKTLDAERYPQHVCAECFGTLKRFNEFQVLVGKTAALLDELFMKITTPEELINEIKQEAHAHLLKTEDIEQEESDPLLYIIEEIDEGQEVKFDITFEAEEPALTQPTLNSSDDEIHLTGNPKKYSATILQNINTGVYKISDKIYSSRIWSIYAQVMKLDGSIIEKIVYCRLCFQLMKYNKSQISNLVRHHCYANINKSRLVNRRELQKSFRIKQNEIQEMLDKISTGIYKITEGKGKSQIWSTFGQIEKADGTTIENIVYCRLCRQPLKWNGKQTAYLMRHKCYRATNETSQKEVEQEGDAVLETESLELIHKSLTKDVRNANVDLAANELNDGDEIEDVLEADPTATKQGTTNDPASLLKFDPATGKLNETNEEVLQKIHTGVYTITEMNTKSKIWTIFAEVETNDNNKKIKNLVYCRTCNRLFKYNEKQLSNLVRHNCYKLNQLYYHNKSTKRTFRQIKTKTSSARCKKIKKLKIEQNESGDILESDAATTGPVTNTIDMDSTSLSTLDPASGKVLETNEEILEKIFSGVYKISERNTKSKIWTVFGEVKTNDFGIKIKSLVYCRTCNRLFKYNEKQLSNLVRHKCYKLRVRRFHNKSTKRLIQKSKTEQDENEDVC